MGWRPSLKIQHSADARRYVSVDLEGLVRSALVKNSARDYVPERG